MTLDVTCPHCGSTEIQQVDHVICHVGIQDWSRAEDGALVPKYDGESDVFWDTSEVHDALLPYTCYACGADLASTDLIVSEVDGAD